MNEPSVSRTAHPLLKTDVEKRRKERIKLCFLYLSKLGNTSISEQHLQSF